MLKISWYEDLILELFKLHVTFCCVSVMFFAFSSYLIICLFYFLTFLSFYKLILQVSVLVEGGYCNAAWCLGQHGHSCFFLSGLTVHEHQHRPPRLSWLDQSAKSCSSATKSIYIEFPKQKLKYWHHNRYDFFHSTVCILLAIPGYVGLTRPQCNGGVFQSNLQNYLALTQRCWEIVQRRLPETEYLNIALRDKANLGYGSIASGII